MNTGLRRVALIISILLMIESFCTAFAFAEDGADGSDVVAAAETEEQETEDPEEEAQEETQDIPSDIPDESLVQAEEDTDKKTSDISLNSDPADKGKSTGSDEQEDPEPEPELKNGWVKKDGKKYYYVDGEKLTGMQKIGKSWYFFSVYGILRTGWRTIDGSRYYFSPKTGKRIHGKKVIKGGTYYFRKNGKMVKGWLKSNGKKYYHRKNGKRVFGSKKLGKYRYYFMPKTGIMKKGWLKYNGKYYYYDKKGHKLFGVQKIGKKTYYLNDRSGAKMSKGQYYLYRRIWTKSSSTSYLIYVDKGGRWVNVFKGKTRHWKLVKRVRCSIGAPSTPTPSGTFKATCKVYHFGEGKGYTCWYATGFIGSSYLMHSVVCYSGTKTPSDGRLGMAISHGCIRMKISNAKWIYDHVPVGTTVFIS